MSTDTNGSPKKYAYKDAVRSFLESVMERYMYEGMTSEEFCAEVKRFYDEHVLSVRDDEDLQMLVEQMIPELIEKLEAQEKSSGSSDAEVMQKIENWILFKDCKSTLEGRPLFSEQRERYLKTERAGGDETEYSDYYLLIEREMETLVRAETGKGGYLGFCHEYWAAKKKVLREKYGIDWRSPAERYPHIIFD